MPDDVSVAGFDDTSRPDVRPPLTTVHQPHADKGAAAVRMLLAKGAGPQLVTFPVSLVVRESTAPPPSDAAVSAGPAGPASVSSKVRCTRLFARAGRRTGRSPAAMTIAWLSATAN